MSATALTRSATRGSSTWGLVAFAAPRPLRFAPTGSKDRKADASTTAIGAINASFGRTNIANLVFVVARARERGCPNNDEGKKGTQLPHAPRVRQCDGWNHSFSTLFKIQSA